MERWRSWTEVAPLPVVGIAMGTFFAIFQYLIPGAPSSRNVATALLQGVIFGAIMTVAVALRRRGDMETIGPDGALARAEMERILRTEVLPDDRAHDGAIRRYLGRRQDQRRRDGPLLLVFVGAFCLFTLGPGFAGGELVWATTGLAGVAVGAWAYRSNRRDLARYDRIEAALLERSVRA